MLDAKHLLRRRGRSGQSLLEFSLVGIPMLFITISVVSISIDMWEYYTLAYATEMTARFVSVHGATCVTNSCTIEVGDVAKFFATQSIALNASNVTVNMTDNSGTTACNPVNSCNSTTTQFPASTANSVGSDITITATYTLKNPFAMYWPPDLDSSHDYTGGAKSRQRIVF